MKKYSLLFKDPLLSGLSSSLLSLPTPFSISFLWNMGFLLGMTLILQIVTGLFLSMNYIPEISFAFESVIHLMRDISSGFMMRYLHMNGASLFFILLYFHLSRGLYFNSFSKLPYVWISGVLILLATMGAAFLGYVLPWGQMSFWGATVITSMLSAVPYVGPSLTLWLWGNFSVSQPTLNRFFSLHFLIPMVLAVLVLVHLIFLHESGSSNPMGTTPDYDKMKFFPYFAIKDSLPLLILSLLFVFFISLSPDYLGDVENFNPASMSTTPPHIQPEWYFLFAYAILRSIPSKLGGVLAMVFSIFILFFLPIKNSSLNNKFSPYKKVFFWCFISVVLLLTWIGSNPVEPPFVVLGQIFTSLYFFLVILL